MQGRGRKTWEEKKYEQVMLLCFWSVCIAKLVGNYGGQRTAKEKHIKSPKPWEDGGVSGPLKCCASLARVGEPGKDLMSASPACQCQYVSRSSNSQRITVLSRYSTEMRKKGQHSYHRNNPTQLNPSRKLCTVHSIIITYNNTWMHTRTQRVSYLLIF